MILRDVPKVINFKFKNNLFSLDCSPWNILCAQEINYDKECGSSDPECDHDYHRCMVIINIFFQDYDLEAFVANNLSSETAGEEEMSEVRRRVTEFLKQVNFSDYISAQSEKDYYGEVLNKEIIGYYNLIPEIEEALTASNFKDFKTHDA